MLLKNKDFVGVKRASLVWRALNTSQKEDVDAQLNMMIRAKYQDINYNGIRKSKLEEWIKEGNPFDNKTVIIDESHNFVSRIVNKINVFKKYLKCFAKCCEKACFNKIELFG